VHGEQRVILRRDLAQRRAARRVDEGKMGVPLDHAGHQELARRVDALGTVGREALRLRHDRGNALVFDQNLCGEWWSAGARPHPGTIDQQAHRFLRLWLANHSDSTLFCMLARGIPLLGPAKAPSVPPKVPRRTRRTIAIWEEKNGFIEDCASSI